MPSLEDFRKLLDDGKIEEAFKTYELDFNEEVFDISGDVEVNGYETEIVWRFQEPNKITMHKKSAADAEAGKSIYYLPWTSLGVTKVTLDGNSPPYFVTSHFSNCRFTIHFHDNEGKRVTVMHVAGNTGGGSLPKGSRERDQLESAASLNLDAAQRTRRLSCAHDKMMSKKTWPQKKAEAMTKGTTYYDTFARVFGVREANGSWIFYAQDINDKGQLLGLQNVNLMEMVGT